MLCRLGSKGLSLDDKVSGSSGRGYIGSSRLALSFGVLVTRDLRSRASWLIGIVAISWTPNVVADCAKTEVGFEVCGELVNALLSKVDGVDVVY